MEISEDLTIVDSNGVPRIILTIVQGSPNIILTDEKGRQRLILGYRHDEEYNYGQETAYIKLHDAAGPARVMFHATKDYGSLSIAHPDSAPGITIATYKDASVPTIEVTNRNNDIVSLADVNTECPLPDDESVMEE